jgi:drug/metabolite transporter (DMT)-like permease
LSHHQAERGSARLMTRSSPGSTTAIAFLAIVLIGGLNGVAIRTSNRELAPFWGGTLRFGIAALVLFGVVALRRVPLPRGAALTGSILYGALGFGAAFGLVYWALVQAPAGLAQVILALVPLLTFLFAVGQGLERFRAQGLAGALVALCGIAIVFAERLGTAAPLLSMVAILAAAACIAESNVVVKRFPRCHPVANNAIAMATGGVMLLGVSLVAGEPRPLPADPRTVAAVAYISLAGSVILFSLFLFVIARWTASASSYVMLLMPLVAVAAAGALLGESVTPAFLIGGALVLAGVYLGSFAPAMRISAGRLILARPAKGLPAPLAVAVGPSSAPAHPGCA